MNMPLTGLERKRLLRLSLIVFVAAFTMRMAMLVYSKPYRNPGVSELRNVALSVGTKGTLSDPYTIPTGPTAHLMPLYPLIAGGIYGVFGTEGRGELVLNLFNVFMASLQFSLIPLVASLCGLPLEWGVAGGLAGALVPVSFLTEIRSMESLNAVLFLVVAILALRTWRSQSLRFQTGLLHGVAWGFLLLVNAAMLPVLGAWALLALWRWRQNWRQVASLIAGAAISLCVVLAPWVVRNQKTFGSTVLLRTNFGLELHVSNNPDAKARFEDNVKTEGYQEIHPSASEEQCRRVIALGEVKFNQEQKAAAEQWIEANPGRFLRLTATRILYFWFPNPGRKYQLPILWLMTILGFAGLYTISRQNREVAFFIGSIWLSFPAVYYIVQSSTRYRLPMLWSLLLPVGAALMSMVRSRSSQRRDPLV